MKDTTIAKAVRWFPGKLWQGERVSFEVTLELHQLAGNERPHFSATVNGWNRPYTTRPVSRDIDFGGCCHELIVKYWKAAALVVAVHLSDDNGVPMYAVENGWYHAGGCIKHGANPNATNPERYPANVDHLASHLRIEKDKAAAIIKSVADGTVNKLAFTLFCDSQLPRWKREADNALTFIQIQSDILKG